MKKIIADSKPNMPNRLTVACVVLQYIVNSKACICIHTPFLPSIFLPCLSSFLLSFLPFFLPFFLSFLLSSLPLSLPSVCPSSPPRPCDMYRILYRYNIDTISIQYRYKIDTILIQYGYNIDTISIQYQHDPIPFTQYFPTKNH